MKEYFSRIVAVALAIFAVTCFVACGDDDDNDDMSAGSVPSPTLKDANGNAVQVTQVGNIWFRYNADGTLESFGDGSDSYSIEGSTFTISDESNTYNVSIALNGSGLITKIHAKMNATSSNGSYEKDDITMNFSYSSNRQLSSCSATGSGSYYEKQYDESESYSGSSNVKYTWSNDNLTQVVIDTKQTGKEDGMSYSEREKGTFVFSYGEQANPVRQFPYFVGEEVVADDLGGLFCIVGLFGYGPAYFPTGYTETWKEDGEKDETNSYSLSYTLNDNGTINTEQKGSYYRVTYQYNTVATRAIVNAGTAEEIVRAVKSQFKNYFKHKH